MNIAPAHSDRTGKDYWKLETNEGNMNVFDGSIAEEITKKGTPNEFTLDIKVSGNFKNVNGISLPEFAQTTVSPTIETPVVPANPVQPPAPYVPRPSQESQRFAGMAISYAKDLVVAKAIDHSNLRSETIAMCDLYNELVDKLNKN